MTVLGSNFTSNSSVMEWNGTPLATTYIATGPNSAQELSAQIPASLVATPGTAQISVKDNSSGVVSNTVVFAIVAPATAAAGVVQLITIAPDGSAANGDSLVAASISQTGRFIAFQSNATNLAPVPSGQQAEIFLRDTCIGVASGCTPSTQLVSVTYDGSTPTYPNRGSAVSADGRYVAFDSTATNILPGLDYCYTLSSCVYLRDTCMGVASGCTPSTVLASVDTDGTLLGGANPTITPDGRFVSFNSTGATLGINQIRVRDTCHGAPAGCTPGTSIYSLNIDGKPGNANSLYQQVTPDGRFAAFISYAGNLADPSNTASAGSQQTFWVRDSCLGAAATCTPTTTREDLSSDGTPNDGNLDILATGSISDNGRFVSFSTGYGSPNLTSQDVNGWGNVYWRDTCVNAPAGCLPTTILISLGNDGSIGNSTSHEQSISGDGRYVVFTSIATNLVPFDNFPAGGWQEIYGRDTCVGAPSGCAPSTVRLAVTQGNPEAMGTYPSGFPVISEDGHYVVFNSNSTNFVPTAKVQNAMVYLAKTGY
jgi:hypothetical protein